MKNGPRLFIMVFAAFSAGLIIYVLGLVVGFFQASTVYVFYWYTSGSYTFIPVFQFELYPRFILAVSPLPFYIDRRSPLTLIFLAFAVLAVVSTYLKKRSTALFLSILAFLTAVTQFIVLTPLGGSEPPGLVVTLFLAFPTLYPLPLMMLLSSKSLYPIILSILFFGAGMLALFAMYVQEKAVLVSSTPISGEHFNALKSIFNRLRILMAPLFIFLLIGLAPVQLFLAEFQNYPPLVFTLMIFHPTISFSYFLWPYLIVFYSLYLIQGITYNRSRDRLAESCILLLQTIDSDKLVFFSG